MRECAIVSVLEAFTFFWSRQCFHGAAFIWDISARGLWSAGVAAIAWNIISIFRVFECVRAANNGLHRASKKLSTYKGRQGQVMEFNTVGANPSLDGRWLPTLVQMWVIVS